MSKDLIRYDLLVQDALKGVVRKVLADAGRDGLPGEHHFFVSFQTDFPGVRLSQRLRDKYPQEMTIVLQHQFWDLNLTDQAIEVGLSFSGIPERLLVPYAALTGFFDPSVSFGLKFEIQADEAAPEPDAPASASRPPRGAGSEPVELQPKKPPVPAIPKPAPKAPAARTDAGKPVARSEPALAKPEAPAAEKGKDDPGTAEVVSLDAFRKKS